MLTKRLCKEQRSRFGIQYKPDREGDDPLTLSEIRSQLPPGNWMMTSFFEQVGVAIQMQIPISHFWAMPEMDKAVAIAYYRVKSTIEEYENVLREREMKKSSHSRGRR